MICKGCPEGRRYAAGSVLCTLYGMIIREDHECYREGGKRHDRDGSDGRDGTDRAELQQDGGDAAGGMPGVLQTAGKRTSVFGIDEEWPE